MKMEYANRLIRRYKTVRSIMRLQNIYTGSYAFVGTGSHSVDNLYPVLSYLNVPVKYICCRSPAKLRLIQRRCPDVRVTVSLDEILADGDVSGVFVSASPESHFALASEVLDSGKPLFVEKPPCPSAEHLRQLIDKTRRHRPRVVMAGMQKRYSPATGILSARLRRGGCTSYNLRYLTGLYPEGDALSGLFIHPLDYVTFLFGRATVLCAECLRTSGGGITLMLMLRHSCVSGVLELSTSYSWTGAREEITVSTARGTYTLRQMEELVYTPRQGSLFGIPVEKVFPRCRHDTVLFGRNSFVPLLSGNQLYVQGYFDEIKTFVDLAENKRGRNLSSLESLSCTYGLIDDIRARIGRERVLL